MRGKIARALRRKAMTRVAYRAGKEAYKDFPTEQAQQPKLEPTESDGGIWRPTPVMVAILAGWPRPARPGGFLVPFTMPRPRGVHR